MEKIEHPKFQISDYKISSSLNYNGNRHGFPSLPERLFWSLLESIPINISIWENGKVIYANPGFYKDLVISPGDLDALVQLTAKDDYIEIHPDDFPENEKELLQIKEQLLRGGVFHREVRMKTYNRSSFHWYNTYVVKGNHKGAEITIDY
jgi:PAS domain-containing protein